MPLLLDLFLFHETLKITFSQKKCDNICSEVRRLDFESNLVKKRLVEREIFEFENNSINI